MHIWEVNLSLFLPYCTSPNKEKSLGLNINSISSEDRKRERKHGRFFMTEMARNSALF
jgi:hypothetical protein